VTLPGWIHGRLDLDRQYPGEEAKSVVAI